MRENLAKCNENPTIETVVGPLKWFDPKKGYGFMTANDGRGDVLVHRAVFDSSNVPAPIDYRPIRVVLKVNAILTHKGWQAVAITATSGRVA